MSLGANILRLRQDKRLSQDQLATAVGVTRQTIGQYEKDLIQPTKAKLADLARVLGVTVGVLYTDLSEGKLTQAREVDPDPISDLPSQKELLIDKMKLLDQVARLERELHQCRQQLLPKDKKE